MIFALSQHPHLLCPSIDSPDISLLTAGRGVGNHRMENTTQDVIAGLGTSICTLDTSHLIRVLGGVATATKSSADIVERTRQWFHQVASIDALSHQICQSGEQAEGEEESLPLIPEFWLWALARCDQADGDGRLALACLTIAVAALREHSRCNIVIGESRLTIFWGKIYEALISPALQDIWTPSWSAQGFLTVPLCSITRDGDIDELISLDVWLPNKNQGNPDFSVHSHKCFSQTWILVGESIHHHYEARRVSQTADATHMEFELTWNAGKVPQSCSPAVLPTGNLVEIQEVGRNLHRRNESYTTPPGAFHSFQMVPDFLHASLFYADSSRGFVQDACVLGPVNEDVFSQFSDVIGETTSAFARCVHLIRSWETRIEEGREYAQKAEWEHSLRAFNSGLSLCESLQDFKNAARYRGIVLGELGNTNRRFGRYAISEGFLKQACLDLQGFREHVTFSGELGVVYRHMGRLEEARDAFQLQYDAAKELQLEYEACRAIGNLGMVNFQLAEQSRDESLLKLAIDQLQERVDRCHQMNLTTVAAGKMSTSVTKKLRQIEVWAAVGLARLSLCHAAQNNPEEALRAAESALEHANKTGDPTVVAISRFFYGRAFAMTGQHDKALGQFNARDACTPAIAFCKEPSKEHHEYLRFLVKSGANLDLTDDQGYQALDYAVFNGDKNSQQLVLEGLRHQFSSEPNVNILLEQRQMEAELRKGYRELFQEKLRPVLLKGGRDCIKKLRVAYSAALAADEGKSSMFDYFETISYKKLLRFGRLPRYSDNLTQKLTRSNGVDEEQFVIFFSYRWLNTMADQDGGTPDDGNHTQYNRIILATEDFLKARNDIDPQRLQIWVDYACVNQDDPTKGVAALPMIIAQCDALISLTDDQYYDRAWCCVEIMMIRALKKSYYVHSWYEQPFQMEIADGSAPDDEGADTSSITKGYGRLRDAPMDLDIQMAEKKLSFERDRAKVAFLERQSKLLA